LLSTHKKFRHRSFAKPFEETDVLPSTVTLPAIERHKAALVRTELSRPVRLALEAGLFATGTTFFDYGCGHGSDARFIAEKGYHSYGYDPYYFPDHPRIVADIVNLGYVVNVIEHEQERRETLLQAWALTKKALIVAAQVLLGDAGKGYLAYNDGVISSRNTFQKYYEQQELKNYIDSVLGVDAIPAGLGVYFVFRDEAQAEAFRASRFRSRATTPRIKLRVNNFDDYRELLDPLMQFFADRGRLPVSGELRNESEVVAEFRTLTRALAVIQQATGKEEWEKITEARKNDLLVYIALSRFGKRPNFTALPHNLQQDIKAFWGNYTNACTVANKLLFSLGQEGVIAQACKRSPIGKYVGTALYIHVSALDQLDPILRIFEGAASRTFGRLEETTLIKLRADQPKVSYLQYPDFDSDPHPALHSSMQADLQGLHVVYRDYSTSLNPPILHRKETFVSREYPLYEKFHRLTAQEEKWGLLDETNSIGTRNGWRQRLSEKSVRIQGHRLCRA
jgi:DNA phosphorothioation-associated putative methyltransferase